MPIPENNVHPRIVYEGTSREYYTPGKIIQMEVYRKIDFHLGKNPNIISNDWSKAYGYDKVKSLGRWMWEN